MVESEMDGECLTERYALVSGNAYYLDAQGSVFLDRLWHKDFMMHLRSIRNMILVAPKIDIVTADTRDLCIALKASGGLRRLKLLWLIVRQADIVQPGTAYWPTG